MNPNPDHSVGIFLLIKNASKYCRNPFFLKPLRSCSRKSIHKPIRYRYETK